MVKVITVTWTSSSLDGATPLVDASLKSLTGLVSVGRLEPQGTISVPLFFAVAGLRKSALDSPFV